MKNKVRNYFIVSLVALYALIALIVFLNVDYSLFESNKAVWVMNIVFGFVLPLVVTLLVFFKSFRMPKYDNVSLPGLYYVLLGFDAILSTANIYSLFKPATLKFTIIFNAIIVVAELIILGYALLANQYIANNQQIQKEKVMFIRNLTNQVDSISLNVNSDLAKKFDELKETIRYSDPMSHDDLNSLEGQISIDISKLEQMVLDNKDQSEIEEMIKKINNEMLSRNAKCKSLKALNK